MAEEQDGYYVLSDGTRVVTPPPGTYLLGDGRTVHCEPGQRLRPLDEWPYCEACQSWHHPDNPTCVLARPVEK